MITTGSPALRALSDPTVRLRGLQNVIGLSEILTVKGSDLPESSATLEHDVLAIKKIAASRNSVLNVNLYMLGLD